MLRGEHFWEELLATEIYRLAHLSLERKSSMSLAFHFLFPLQIAAAHLRQGSREYAQLTELTNSFIVQNCGWGIGKIRNWDGMSVQPGFHHNEGERFFMFGT